jgi:hypothetical protein
MHFTQGRRTILAMRKLRIFAIEIIVVGLLLGWLLWKYPEFVDSIVPWLALAVAWHATWEFVIDPLRGFLVGSRLRVRPVGRVVLILIAVGLTIVYWFGIKKGLKSLANYHAKWEQTHEEKTKTAPVSTTTAGPVTSASANAPTTSPNQRTSNSMSRAPHITMKYKGALLPISISTGETVWICALEQTKTIKCGIMPNPFGVVRLWPTYQHIVPPVIIGVAKLETDRVVFKLRMEIEINNVPKEFDLEALRPGKNETVYFINQSSAPEFIKFPESATFELQGVPARQATTVSFDGTNGIMSWVTPGVEMLPVSQLKWDGEKLLDSSGRPMQ